MSVSLNGGVAYVSVNPVEGGVGSFKLNIF